MIIPNLTGSSETSAPTAVAGTSPRNQSAPACIATTELSSAVVAAGDEVAPVPPFDAADSAGPEPVARVAAVSDAELFVGSALVEFDPGSDATSDTPDP